MLKIVSENNLAKNEVEALANERFGKGVKALNKLEASGLIEELLEKTGQNRGNGRSRYQSRFQHALSSCGRHCPKLEHGTVAKADRAAARIDRDRKA